MQRHYFANNGPSSQSYGFYSSHVWMWELAHKENWALKNWCFELWCWRRLLRVPWTARRYKPVHPKGDQSWILIGKTDPKTEAPILWPTDVKNWLIGKDPDTRKHLRPEEKGTIEDKMVWWHHWLNGHGFEQAPGGSLVCSCPWGHKVLDTTERLNRTE